MNIQAFQRNIFMRYSHALKQYNIHIINYIRLQCTLLYFMCIRILRFIQSFYYNQSIFIYLFGRGEEKFKFWFFDVKQLTF